MWESFSSFRNIPQPSRRSNPGVPRAGNRSGPPAEPAADGRDRPRRGVGATVRTRPRPQRPPGRRGQARLPWTAGRRPGQARLPWTAGRRPGQAQTAGPSGAGSGESDAAVRRAPWLEVGATVVGHGPRSAVVGHGPPCAHARAATGGRGARARIRSAARSPTISTVTTVLTVVIVGNTDASAIRRPAIPRTRSCGSTTAI